MTRMTLRSTRDFLIYLGKPIKKSNKAHEHVISTFWKERNLHAKQSNLHAQIYKIWIYKHL